MSSSENTPVQDVLRKVAKDSSTGTLTDVIKTLRIALKLEDRPSYQFDLIDCLSEIADRIDAQTVVEVTVPPAKPKNAVKMVQTLVCGDVSMWTLSCYHNVWGTIAPKYCPFCGMPVEGEASDE